MKTAPATRRRQPAGPPPGGLAISRREGECLTIICRGVEIKVGFARYIGGRGRLTIKAPPEVTILRDELIAASTMPSTTDGSTPHAPQQQPDAA